MADRITKRIEGNTEITTVETDEPICDFCCNRDKPVRWSFNVQDSEMETIGAAEPGTTNAVLRQGKVIVETTKKLTLESVGGRWAACDDCRYIIEQRLVIPLALTATAQYIYNNKITVHSDEVYLRLLQQIKNVQYRGFWKNWDGQPAQRWTKEQ